jgi:hypothetical protein
LTLKDYEIDTYIHTYHSCFIPEEVADLKYSSETPTFYQSLPRLSNTADVTGGKPIAFLLQSISGISAINPLVAFYDIHGRKKRRYSFILSRTPHEIDVKPLSIIVL